MLAFPVRDHRIADGLGVVQSEELEAVPIQVITFCDLPVKLDPSAIDRLGRETKGFIRRQELVAAAGCGDQRQQIWLSTRVRCRQFDFACPFLRWVAQADVGAALGANLQLQLLARCRRASDGDIDTEFAPIDLHAAEELIFVDLALGESGLTKRNPCRLGLKSEPLTVQVVTVCDIPIQGKHVLPRGHLNLKRPLWRQQVRFL